MVRDRKQKKALSISCVWNAIFYLEEKIMKRKTVSDFMKLKGNKEKITMLTAYDYPTAKIIDEAGVDAILVGDSLGMVVLGYEDTTRVTIEDIIHHTKAVVRGVKNAMVIADMPFLSYHTGVNESVKNAGRIIRETGCKAVKLEGGKSIVEDVKAIISAGIPVVGHLGYTPQSVNVFGGHKVQGKNFDNAKKILEDAFELQKAGVFAIVLECVPYKVAGIIADKMDVPVIGIGSGNMCDGQVLVTYDMIGLFRDFNPKHSKRYFEFGDKLEESVEKYILEVKNMTFPSSENSFEVDEKVVKQLKDSL